MISLHNVMFDSSQTVENSLAENTTNSVTRSHLFIPEHLGYLSKDKTIEST